MVGKAENKNKTTKKNPTANHPSSASPIPPHISSSKPFGLLGMVLFTGV